MTYLCQIGSLVVFVDLAHDLVDFPPHVTELILDASLFALVLDVSPDLLQVFVKSKILLMDCLALLICRDQPLRRFFGGGLLSRRS